MNNKAGSPEDQKRNFPAEVPLCSSILRNDLFFVIAATGLANSVGNHQGSALAALDQCGISHLPVRSAGISVSLRGFIFRTNGHKTNLPSM